MCQNSELIKHYRLVEGFRIMISSWQALIFCLWRGDVPILEGASIEDERFRERDKYKNGIINTMTLSTKLSVWYLIVSPLCKNKIWNLTFLYFIFTYSLSNLDKLMFNWLILKCFIVYIS